MRFSTSLDIGPSSRSRAWLAVIVLAFWLGGCTFVQAPNPNLPSAGAVLAPDVLLRNMSALAADLDDRVAKRLVSPEERDRCLGAYLEDMMSGVDLGSLPVDSAWQYGDAFRLAHRWDQAYRLYKAAARAAKDEDRRVNDRLRLAVAAANLGRVDEAIAEAKTTFGADPRAAAPILYAVLYELTPAAQGKGRDAELAQVLERAIGEHMRTVVDAKSEAGRAFLAARAHHVRRAWMAAVMLYQNAGKDAEARRTLERAERMAEGFGQA